MRNRNGIFRTIEGIGERDLDDHTGGRPRPLPGLPGSPGKCIKDIAQTKVPEQVVVTGWPVAGQHPRV